MRVMNPFIEGYADIWDIDKFLEVIKGFFFRKNSDGIAIFIENLRDGTVKFDVLKEVYNVFLDPQKRKLVAVKFIENLKMYDWREAIKRKDKYIFVFFEHEAEEFLDFLDKAISILGKFILKIRKNEEFECTYVEIEGVE